MSSDLRVAARGVGWNYLGSGVTLTAQVLYTALTARLVSPAGFGAYAAAQALVALVGYFGLATLGNAVIRHEREGRTVAGTAFTLSILAGLAASAAVFLGAGLWAHLWGVPESESLGRLFSVVVLLTAVASVPLALLRKALEYRRAALVEALSQVAGMAVGAVVAFELRSPTALVIGQAVAAALVASAAIVAARRRLALAFSQREARTLLAFAGQVSGQNLVYYGLYTAPSLLVSRMFGAVTLGGYNRANLMVTLPVTHLWTGVTKTLYPLITRARNDAARLRELIESTVETAAGLSWPLFAAVAGASPLIVRVLLGTRFADVAPLLPPIIVFGAVNLVYVVAGNPLEVLGYQRVIWRVQLLWIFLLAAVIASSVLVHTPIERLLWLVAAVHVLVHAAKLLATARIGLLRLGRVLHGYGLAVAVSAPFWLVAAAVDRLTVGWQPLATRVAAEAVAVLGLLTLTSVVLPSTPLGRLVRSGLGVAFDRWLGDGPIVVARRAGGGR